jgi:hypothetical protein
MASLGIGSCRRCGLERTAAGKVGVRRRICRPHLRIELGWCWGDELAGIRESWDEGTPQDVDFTVDGGWSVADGVEVSVKLELVVVEL